MAGFPGFSRRAVAFYGELAGDNTREFWAANKEVYEAEVREPMQALADELAEEFGAARLFRPHRDTRFSKDKTPYKTHQAAFAGPAVGIGYYVQLDARGLLAGGGFRSHGAVQVSRYRRAVDQPGPGAALAAVVAELEAAGFDVEGPALKTAPRGFSTDHPQIDLLRRTSLMAVRSFGRPGWLATPRALDEVRATWRAVAPLTDWVATHVGLDVA